MLIDVSCPTCGRRYHLQPELRGQRIRCPNPVCRDIFEVKPDGEETNGAAPPPPPAPEKPKASGGYQSGAVGQVVPILSAEMAAEAAPAWTQAPPVRKAPATVVPAPKKTDPPKSRPPAPPVDAPAEKAPPAPGPQEVPPGAWEPPPVRRGPETEIREVPAGEWDAPPVRRGAAADLPPSEPEPAVDEPVPAAPTTYPKPRRRKPWLLIGVMGLIVLGFGAGVVSLIQAMMGENEEKRFEQARKDYAAHNFSKAEADFRKLASEFPDSPSVGTYRLLAELSQVRNGAYAVGGNREETLARLLAFIETNKSPGGRLLKPYEADIGETLQKLSAELADQSRKALPDLDKARQFQARAKEAYTTQIDWMADAKANTATDTLLKELIKDIDDEQKRQDFLAMLDKMPPTLDNLQEAEREARKVGLAGDAEVAKRLAALQTRVLQQVGFQTENRPASEADAEREPPLWMVPPRGPIHPVSAGPGDVVFALARGVLYALSEKDGHLLWACRVGIDTATPPVLVPGGKNVLVLSTDPHRLTARETATGKALWQQTLPAPCLGRPMFVGEHVYLPTYDDGKVHEFNWQNGTLVGSFNLGQRLRVGGVHQEGTDLVYFPGESRFLYVLDVRQHLVTKVVSTGQPDGSLRTEPIIPPSADPAGPSYLVLTQADGLTGTRLRCLQLPLDDTPRETSVTVRGWPSYPPGFDAEKIIVTTDAGILAPIGINQPNNKDNPLFPILEKEMVVEAPGARPEPALVVHTEGNDLWVLVQGRLHRYTLGLDRDGFKAAPVWPQAVVLGTPLHPAQVNAARDTLFVVSRANAQTCLATAIEAATGRVRWQRQLGMLCQGEPLPVGEQVVALDGSGGLFRFDAMTSGWHFEAPPAEATAEKLLLLPAADGQSAYALSFAGRPGKATLRQIGAGPALDPMPLDLPAALAGTPALGTDCLVLPLADGSLYRQPLQPGQGTRGPPWRGQRAAGDATGLVVFLGGDHFLVADGSNGLQRLRWTAADWSWDKEPGTTKPLPMHLAARVVGISGLLTAAGAESRLAVADAEGMVTLLQASNLKPLRRWTLAGKVTAGPFVRGGRFGCIVDQKALVWLDPEREKPAWTHRTDDPIVGQPQQIGDLQVVADLAGRIVGLNAMTGKPAAAGYTLQASAVPAAAPVTFGKDRLFVPLSDGTALLLPASTLSERN